MNGVYPNRMPTASWMAFAIVGMGALMPTNDVTIHLCEDGRHEILNDSNKEEVVADLAGWIRRFG